MAQYTLSEVKNSDFQDPHGNYWLNVAFEEFGEPVSLVVKDPSKFTEGMTLNGEIKQVAKKNGNGTYNRFYRDKPQDFGGQRSAPKQEWKARDDKAIQAQWAIGQANLQVANGVIDAGDLKAVEDLAKEFFNMIDRVKTAQPTGTQTNDLPPIELYNDEAKVDLADIPFN